MKILLGITGASGCVIALRLAEILRKYGFTIIGIYTRSSLIVADTECVSANWFIDKLRGYVDELYSEDDIKAPIASSSNILDAYIIAPASIKTMALIINGIASNLLVRAILNGLRMRKPVVAVVRESPLGEIELEILYKASKKGITIVPAVVGFYTYPQHIGDVVDFIVGKTLDVLGIQNNLYRRWRGVRDPQYRDPCEYLYGSIKT